MGPRDDVVEPLKGYFDDVVFRIVCDANDRQPFRGDLVTKAKSCDLDLGALPRSSSWTACQGPHHAPLSIL
jgi:hypothetical protein